MSFLKKIFFRFDYCNIKHGADLFSLIHKHMANVSSEFILELQTIIKEDYDKELSTAEVSQIANDLVCYFDLLGKIYHQNINHSQEPETSA